MEQRAYTLVDPGTARVGNAWVERSWSAFIGQTIELVQTAGPTQWLTAQSPEIQFTLDDGRTFDVMALGEVEWSEERSPHAASLVLRKGSPEGVGAYIRTLALHKTAALVREVRLFNTGPADVTIASVQYDFLPLQGERHPHEAGLAVVQGERGLLIGVEGAAEVSPGVAGNGPLTVSCVEAHTLRRGSSWELPPVYLLPFSGGLGEHVTTQVEKFHKQREAMRTWLAEREAAIREEAESN